MGFLNKEGLKYLWETYIEKALEKKVDKVTGKGLSTNDYTTEEKNKLSGISAGAEVNQNAFSIIRIGNASVEADSKTDTLTFAAGANITITPDADKDEIVIAATDTIYTHPIYTAKEAGLYKITVDGTGHVSGATVVSKDDIVALGIPGSTTVYEAGNGISIDGNKINNIGVRSVGTGTTNGTITVNINGEDVEVAIAGLGSAAFTDSSAYATADQGTKADNAMPKTGGTFTGDITLRGDPTDNLHPATKAYVDSEVLEVSDAVATKADNEVVSSHISNTDNPHSVTKSQIGLGNVENKSSETIRSEITALNISDALGYEPARMWISYTDENGNATTVPYLHWVEE